MMTKYCNIYCCKSLKPHASDTQIDDVSIYMEESSNHEPLSPLIPPTSEVRGKEHFQPCRSTTGEDAEWGGVEEYYPRPIQTWSDLKNPPLRK